MRVLVVEDNALLRHHLKVQIQDAGHQVDDAEDAKEADYYLNEHLPDIAIVDLGLPDEDGLSLIRRWRSNDVSLPILVLTARESWQDKVEVLSAGADDYVTKPFHIEEVMARMQALMRRNSGLASQVISLPPFQVDLSRRELSINDEVIKLTAFEYTIMETLIRNNGKVVSKDSLMLQLYPDAELRESHTIDVLMGRLRKKIQAQYPQEVITTVRGQERPQGSQQRLAPAHFEGGAGITLALADFRRTNAFRPQLLQAALGRFPAREDAQRDGEACSCRLLKNGKILDLEALELAGLAFGLDLARQRRDEDPEAARRRLAPLDPERRGLFLDQGLDARQLGCRQIAQHHAGFRFALLRFRCFHRYLCRRLVATDDTYPLGKQLLAQPQSVRIVAGTEQSLRPGKEHQVGENQQENGGTHRSASLSRHAEDASAIP